MPGRNKFSEDWINSLLKICFFCNYCYWSYNKPSSLCISLALPMHAYIKSMAMPIEQTVSQCSIVFAHACIRMFLFNIERLLLCGLWWCLCKQARLPGSSCLLLPTALSHHLSALGKGVWLPRPKTHVSHHGISILKIICQDCSKINSFSALVMCVMVQSFSLRPIILIL